MTEEQIDQRAVQMLVRSYQMIELGKRKDKDIYDIIYNVSQELEDINPKYTKKLREFAIECKRRLIDPQVVQLAKDLDFGNIETMIIENYGAAVTEFFMKEKHLNERDARQEWLACDEAVMRHMGVK